ncbi:MAG: hypothetical protein JNL45_12505 [Hyphomicrobium sp.]|nr:hypothetical protein [Hyphomicrobium sp.]
MATNSQWAEYLSNFALTALIEEGSREAPFIVRHPDDDPCLVVPVVYFDGEAVTVYVFYAPKNRLSIQAVMDEDPKRLTTEWQRYCRAFAVARLSPKTDRDLILLDYGATRRAAAALGKPYNARLTPPLRDIDKALGTKLDKVHGVRWLRTDKWGRSLVQPTL